MAAAVDVHGGTGIATAFWKSWKSLLHAAVPKFRVRTPDDERRALEKKISETKCPIIVLIDELDWVEDDEVRAVAQLIKAVGDIRGVSYLVAYDADRVIQALGRGDGDERRRSGEHYLEKIIQHPIPLRPLFAEDVQVLFKIALADHGVNLEDAQTKSQQAILDHLVGSIETPRKIKRLVGAFSVMERAVRGEICPCDVLGYCWILTKAPSVRDKIAAHVDELVNDPGERTMMEQAVLAF